MTIRPRAIALFGSVALLSSSLFGGTNGEELKLTKKPDGRYSFGATYAYDEDFAWMTQYATDISAKDLQSMPSKVKWNVFNKKTGRFLTNWTETEKRSLKFGAFKIDSKRVVQEILINQTDIELVFGIEKDGKVESKYFLPIGEFCKKDLTDQFKNLTDTDKRCDQIKEADVHLAMRDNEGGTHRPATQGPSQNQHSAN